MSGGEKLRINLARALYRYSEILLLDEVTSALDKSTSEDVENALLSLVALFTFSAVRAEIYPQQGKQAYQYKDAYYRAYYYI